MIAYLDASALVKLIVAEAGSDVADAAWGRASGRYAAIHGYAELRAAVAAARRAGRIGPEQWTTARRELEKLWARVIAVQLDETLVREAGDLAERHALRAADAIHLAAAQRIASGPTAFVAFDARLCEAAAVEGLIVLPERP